MNNFEKLKKDAIEKWRELHASVEPIIYIGAASCGMAAGALDILEAVEKTLEEKHLKAKIIKVGCIGPCYLEPLMDIAIPGKPRISYANVTPQKVPRIIESYLINGNPEPLLALAHFGNGNSDFPNEIPKFFELPMLKSQVRIVLRNCGMIDPEEIDHYIANDGYSGLIKALLNGPEKVIEIVKDAGLRGRGGAGFPTYKKWEICRAAKAPQKYMICNADEGDPGAFMNRSLIEGDPHAVLEGLLIAAYAIGATHGYVYIRAEYRGHAQNGNDP